MINVSDKSACFGCGGCVSICPVKCIEMASDEEGFLYPIIKKRDACTNCGACEKACPINKKDKTNSMQEVYWAKNLDDKVRLQSSSGGVFFALAQYVLEKKGVVIGAAFSHDFYTVEHIVVQDIEGLADIQGSKYIQSNIKDTYIRVKRFLQENRYVLFSGTPCQIAGLKSFLNKQYDKLLTMDIVCHGVPSPHIWKLYTQNMERKYGGMLKDVTFRNKKSGWKNYSIIMKFENNKIYQNRYTDDIFMRGFLSNIFLRPSCYNCKFKKGNYWSDITLGDFWGIANIFPEIDDDKGISVVIVNTEKGKELFEKIKYHFSCEEVTHEQAIDSNKSIVEASIYPPERKKFFLKCKKKGLEPTIECYTSRTLSARVQRKIRRIINGVAFNFLL